MKIIKSLEIYTYGMSVVSCDLVHLVFFSVNIILLWLTIFLRIYVYLQCEINEDIVRRKTLTRKLFEQKMQITLFIHFFLPPRADGLVVCHLPYGPTASFSISNTVMRHDIPNVGTMSEAFPHLIFHNFKTKLGQRVCSYV